jgi:spore coat protein U-like protein
MFYRAGVFIGLLAFFLNQSTLAQAGNGTLAVSVTVGDIPPTPPTPPGGHCVLNSTIAMPFPNYSTLNPNPSYTSAWLEVTCSLGVPYNISINQGLGAGATVYHRFMTRSTARTNSVIAYRLFQKANYTGNWGNTPGKDTLHQLGTNLAQRIPVYGEIPAGQLIEAGSYWDRVTITLTF